MYRIFEARGQSTLNLPDSYHKFKSVKRANDVLESAIKRTAARASPMVVSLICHAGEELLSIGTGTIIECDEEESGSFRCIILTSAILLRSPSGTSAIPSDLKINIYRSCGDVFQGQVVGLDFHYGVAAIEIKSAVPLSKATLRFIDDSLAIKYESVAMDQVTAEGLKDSTSFQLRPHQPNRFNVHSGGRFIALGRFFTFPFDIMAAPGGLSSDEVIDCFDCKELLMTNCTITKVGIGGPLINCHGEVIGINFFAYGRTAFLPINIAFKCLENFKRNRRVPRPWLGLEIANLYRAKLAKLEKLSWYFPDIVKGVVVKQVKAKSPAEAVGLRVDDVIIKCGRNSIGSPLEFIEALWDCKRKHIKIVVVRPCSGERFKLTMTVKSCPTENRWPALEASRLPPIFPWMLTGEIRDDIY